MRLQKARDFIESRVHKLEDTIINPEAEEYEVGDAEMRLGEAQHKLKRARAAVRQQEQALGVEARVQLEKLINSPFIAAQMNARALKLRLREKLCRRKWELERIERSYRKQVNGMFICCCYCCQSSAHRPSLQNKKSIHTPRHQFSDATPAFSSLPVTTTSCVIQCPLLFVNARCLQVRSSR